MQDADDPRDGAQRARLPAALRQGRGVAGNPNVRFSEFSREAIDDGWGDAGAQPELLHTTLIVDTAKSVITRNDSPDVPFERSINPYRGCEHGCVYCFARPTHAYLGLSPGLDFETRIAYKPDAPVRLREELAHPSYRCAPIALGVNTDAWQPSERRLGLTRAILELLRDCRHPLSIVTKSALIERDAEVLADMAKDKLVLVMFSVTTLNTELARRMEPRAASPRRRLQAMRLLHEAGVPVGVLFAPLIPALNDHEMEQVLSLARDFGAESAGYILLRLPHEVRDLFKEWLAHHEPGKAKHIMSLVRQMRGGKDYDSTFGERMRGTGALADVIARRFEAVCERLRLNRTRRELDCSRFRPPRRQSPQMTLF